MYGYVPSLETLFGRDAEILRTKQFQLLLASNLNGAIGIVVVSPILDTLTGAFAVSPVEMSLIISMYTLPGIVGIPVLGIMADRLGRKRILVSSLLLFGTAGSAISFTTEFTHVLVLRTVQGIGYAGIIPIVIILIGDIYTGSREATAHGLRYTSSGFSESIFPILSGVLVAIAWQFPFLMYVIAFPIALAVWLWFDEPLTMHDSPDGGGRTEGVSYLRQLARLVSNPRIGTALLALGVPTFFFTAFLTYNSFVVIRIIDGSPVAAGILITVLSIGSGVAGSQTGRISNLFGSRVPPLIGGQIVMGGGLAMFARAPDLPLAAVGIGIMGLGVGSSFSLLRSVITRFSPAEFRGGIVGLGESMIRLSNTVTPILLGGFISLLEARMGFNRAVQQTILLTAVAATCVGVGALLIHAASDPPSPEST